MSTTLTHKLKSATMANVSVSAIEKSLSVWTRSLPSNIEVKTDSFRGGAYSRYGHSSPSNVEVSLYVDGKFKGGVNIIANGYGASRGEISTKNGLSAARVEFAKWIQKNL